MAEVEDMTRRKRTLPPLLYGKLAEMLFEESAGRKDADLKELCGNISMRIRFTRKEISRALDEMAAQGWSDGKVKHLKFKFETDGFDRKML